VSKRRLVITAVLAGQSQSEVARGFGVCQGWISRLMARYRLEGEAAFEPRSRRPKTSPQATPPPVVELVVRLRKELTGQGLDAGPVTIAWHLEHHHRTELSVATIGRILTARGLVIPEPKKRPKASYLRFEADLPNERWQADFTHYRLTNPDGTPGAEVEILCWVDDHSRYALSVTAHPRVTGRIVLTAFRNACDRYGTPASTLTDNAMVFTTRLSGGSLHGTRGRNAFEHDLRIRGVVQINSTPNHPTTCGKVERFQQTLKRWLAAQPEQPATLEQLQTLLDRFTEIYNNHHRPHRSLPHRATPATIYAARPKTGPGERSSDTHDRVRRDKVDAGGKITLRHGGRLYSIGIGRTHARTRVIVLVQDLQIRVVDAATGQLLRELVLDPTKRYQPTGRPPGPPRKRTSPNPQSRVRAIPMS
jgi:transposase InsO family protein